MADIIIDSVKNTVKLVSSLNHLYDYYEDKRYFFSKEILSRYFLSLKTKPFVILTGISGTGKTKIAQIFAEYMSQDEKTDREKENRYSFVPVRPDWMDNKGLLGYHNILDDKYYATPVLCLLLEADKHPDKPFFVILDEMNLAKVEQYFSDFLSVMESRTSSNPRGEMIVLHSSDKPLYANGDLLIPSRIHIPKNVYFTGTVNIDESTYMFSPKVLDRANVIEFNDVNIQSYEKGVVVSDKFAIHDPDVRKQLLSIDDDNPFCSKKDFLTAMNEDKNITICLSEILDILRPFNLHFGYRVINEISRYYMYAVKLIHNINFNEVMDIQILQKILPKFHGAQAKLESPLSLLLAYCCDDELTENITDDYLHKAVDNIKEARFPRSAQKLARMLLNLRNQGYTSFIE